MPRWEVALLTDDQRPTPQELYLRLIEMVSFHECDGARVVADLRRRRDLWDAALMTRSGRESELGIILFSLPGDLNNVDTLYLSTTRDRLPALLDLAGDWGGEIDLAPAVDLQNISGRAVCVRCWWD